jgi:hypothetical protein
LAGRRQELNHVDSEVIVFYAVGSKEILNKSYSQHIFKCPQQSYAIHPHLLVPKTLSNARLHCTPLSDQTSIFIRMSMECNMSCISIIDFYKLIKSYM